MKHTAWLFLIVLFFVITCKEEDNESPGTTAEEIAPDKRAVIISACELKFASLQNKSAPEAGKEIAAWLATQPEFIESGYDEAGQNAWGIFSDGRFLLIGNNRQPGSPDDLNSRVGVLSEAINGRANELPFEKRVRLLSGLGDYFIDYRFLIGSYFKSPKTAYVPTEESATIDVLKTINEETGVLYLNTHGGHARLKDSLKINGTTIPISFAGLWTSDVRSNENDAKYKDDLSSHTLGYMIAYNKKDGLGLPVAETHYAITDKFIKKYIKLGANALVYMDACGSLGADLTRAIFSSAVGNKATYVGWSAPATDRDACKSATFFFDRMLGARNKTPGSEKETPDQRPFDVESVLWDLRAKGLGVSTNNGVKATLDYASSGQADPEILAPSISYLDIDEFTSKLTINGRFGDDPRQNGTGEVTVNGQKVTIESWEKDKIECTIPFKGSGAAGDVIVKARGHESNAVPLTEWYITFMWTENGPALYRTAEIVLHLRADVHRLRDESGRKPRHIDEANDAFPMRVMAKDSKVTMSVGGSCSYSCACDAGLASHTNSLTGGQVDLAYSVNSSVTNSFMALYGWNEERNTISVFSTGVDMTSFKDRLVVTGGDCSETLNDPLPFQFLISEGITEEPLALKLTDPAGFNFTIKGGEKDFETVALGICACDGSPEVPVKLTWVNAEAKFPPTDKTAARVGDQ